MITLRQLLSTDSNELDDLLGSLSNIFQLGMKDRFLRFLSETSDGNDKVNKFLENCMRDINIKFSIMRAEMKAELVQSNSNTVKMQR